MEAVVHHRQRGLALTGSGWALLSMALLLSFSLAFRLWLNLSHVGFLGTDGGAYLLSAQHVLGRGVDGLDFPRPPLAPGWLLVPFVAVLGDDLGLKAWSAAASWSILPALWLLASRVLPRWQAVAAVAALSVDLLMPEMWAQGALPILGFAELCILLWAVLVRADMSYYPQPRITANERAASYALTFGVPLLALTNATAFGIGAIAVAGLVLGLWLVGGWWRIVDIVVPLAIGCLLAIVVALAWYGSMAGGAQTRFDGPLLTLSGPGLVWMECAVALALAWWGWRRREDEPRALAVMLAAIAILLPLASYDEALSNVFYRARYFASVPIAILGVMAAAWYAPRGEWRPVWHGALVGGWLVAVGLNAWVFGAQARYSDMLTPDTAKAIAYIKEHAHEGPVYTNDISLGLWTAALTGRETAWTHPAAPPERWRASDEAVRCALGWVGPCESPRPAYVLVETRFQAEGANQRAIYGAPERPWATMPPGVRQAGRWGTVVLWEEEQ